MARMLAACTPFWNTDAFMLLLLLPARLLAAEPTLALPPVPLQARPSAFWVIGYALPAQSPDYGPTSERLVCPVQVTLAADGQASFEAPDCPAPMQEAALDAARTWRFRPIGEAQPSTAELLFVQRTNPTLGSVSHWAEIDPGAERSDWEGVPGLKLASPARPRKPVPLVLPKAARKGGLVAAPCAMQVRVSSEGAVLESQALDCPAALAEYATSLLARTPFEPARVDGRRSEDVVDLDLDFQDTKR
jgi:hypothetical protein